MADSAHCTSNSGGGGTEILSGCESGSCVRFASSALPACAGSGFFLPDHGRAARGRADAGRTAVFAPRPSPLWPCRVPRTMGAVSADNGRCVGGGDGVKTAEECATDVRPVPGEPLGRNTCGVADRRRIEVSCILREYRRTNVSARTHKVYSGNFSDQSTPHGYTPWEKVHSASTLRKHANEMCRARSKHRHSGGVCAGGVCATRRWVCVQCRLSVRRCPMPLLPLSRRSRIRHLCSSALRRPAAAAHCAPRGPSAARTCSVDEFAHRLQARCSSGLRHAVRTLARPRPRSP